MPVGGKMPDRDKQWENKWKKTKRKGKAKKEARIGEEVDLEQGETMIDVDVEEEVDLEGERNGKGIKHRRRTRYC